MNRQDIWNTLDNKILPLVQRPARYIGGEVNSVSKNLDEVSVRIALVFPDVYEIGMSNLGLKILYEEINSKDDFYAERAFSPWIDMEKKMREHNVPMFSLETHSPLTEFDIIGFSLQYELCYTNVLNILDLAGIPVRTEERLNGSYPLIIGGGIMAYTPEPISAFIDLFVIGDGEDIVVKILEFYKKYGGSLARIEFLEKIAKEIEGVYVPALYDARPDAKGRLSVIKPKTKDVPEKIKKHILKDFSGIKPPEKPIVPLIEAVHDRISIEIMRGCPRSCRFCQAGILYKPVRKRSVSDILDCAYRSIKNTGYGEIGLLSLSSTDFGGIEELTETFMKTFEENKMSVSLPSMRVDSFSLSLIEKISKTKKTGITLAPEVASERLLNAINKGYKPQDVVNVARDARKLGYRVIKLYFMIGLPGEDESDLNDLINLLNEISRIGFLQVNVSISTMIPKPFTPFQWVDMISPEKIKEKQEYLHSRVKKNRIKLKFHNCSLSLLEGAFGRGDRRFGDVIYKAWQLGARFDQWDECFRYDIWEKAFKDCGINMEDYLAGWQSGDSLPWDHIDIGIEEGFLLKEYSRALEYNVK